MPELYLKIMDLFRSGEMDRAREIQYEANNIISAMGSCHGNLYAVMKEVMKRREGLELGGVRRPLPGLVPEDMPQVEKCAAMIDAAIAKYC